MARKTEEARDSFNEASRVAMMGSQFRNIAKDFVGADLQEANAPGVRT
jgi:hypothetical protein